MEFEPKMTDDIYLSARLVGQDDHLDKLFSLFEQLQLATVETCRPDLDLLTFSETAVYFAAIIKKGLRVEPLTQPASPTSKYEPSNLWSEPSPNYNRNKRKMKMSFTMPLALKNKITVPDPKRTRISTPPGPVITDAPLIDLLDLSGQELEGVTGEHEWKRWTGYGNSPANTTEEASDTEWHESALGILGDSMPAFMPRKNSNLVSGIRFGREEGNKEAEEEANGEGLVVNQLEASSTGTTTEEAIGLIYLVDVGTLANDPLRAGELNIGIILDRAHRGNGYARQAIDMVLEYAFTKAQCHRVQAILPNHIAKDRAICLFTQMRFDHEGTRRRAFFSPMECVYKDVTYMALLDTDWALRNSDGVRAEKVRRPAPQSVWDELFTRHQREREELLNWEESQWQHFQTSRAQTPTQSDFRMKEESEENAVTAGVSPVPWTVKMEPETEGSRKNYSFVTPSDSDSEDESTRSASPGGYLSAASSSMSAWDIVDTSDSDYDSSSSSWSFDSLDDEAALDLIHTTSQ
ncbi:hypothetical protein H0H87_012068 [Tephrocybe sp. NHM501043]|nr:hypothetical protein H0H87_012068 [Tephrocybe sp. NHM501043]